MKPMTFNEWRTAGFRVKKGEKAAGRNRFGIPTFTRDQVEADSWFDRETRKEEPADG